MSDITNTGDIHGAVAEALGHGHEHHGQWGTPEVGAFDAYGHGHPGVADALPTPTHAANENHPPLPKPANDSFAAKHPRKPAHIDLAQHATLVNMLHTSKTTENRLEHLLSNVHSGNAASRAQLKSWVARNYSEKAEMAGLWDQTAHR